MAVYPAAGIVLEMSFNLECHHKENRQTDSVLLLYKGKLTVSL